MPKSPSSSPSNSNSLPKHPSADDPSTRMSDVALRKKKNADAQAAFRARRANYIATLEETVTSLESVVLQLQDSCREARNESQELRQENARLRHEFRERDKVWKALWQAKKTGQGLESDDLPSFSSNFPASQLPGTTGLGGSSSLPQFSNDNLPYRSGEDPPTCQVSYNSTSVAYPSHSPSLPYASPDSNVPGDLPSHSINQRLPKFNAYPYGVHSSSTRDSRWQAQPLTQTASSSGDSATMASNQSSHSPAYVESPTLTSSEMPYVTRFSADDAKLGVATLDSAPYVFPSSLPHSRSMSPTNSNHGSSSSTSITSFPFTFGENSAPVGQDRTDFDYRKHSLQHSTEMTLHGGTAAVSVTPSADATRYRIGGLQRAEQGPDNSHPLAGPISASDNGSPHDRGSSDGDGGSELYSRLGGRKEAIPSHSSRSPSPSVPAISCTVAVIKAHAFGALRRTRARSKRSSEGAAKVAMDVLESRGIGTGVVTGSKRPRLQDDDLDLEET